MEIKEKNYFIYFGNKNNSIDPDCYKNPEKPEYLDFLDKNIKDFGLENLVFAKQTHGTNGFVVNEDFIKVCALRSPWAKHGWQLESDYIITDQKNIAIGVLTADCLPIILVESQVCAVIHAGWRGAVNGIIENCVNNLINNIYQRGIAVLISDDPILISATDTCSKGTIATNKLKNFINTSTLTDKIFH